MNLSLMERCELLHSIGSVCSTTWSMRWTRGNWVIVTNPAIEQDRFAVAGSRLSSSQCQALSKLFGRDCTCQQSSQEFATVNLQPSLVLKKQGEPKVVHLKKLYLFAMIQKVVATGSHLWFQYLHDKIIFANRNLPSEIMIYLYQFCVKEMCFESYLYELLYL